MKTGIDMPEALSQMDLNVEKLRNRAIPVSPPIIPPRSSSVPNDRCFGEGETHDLGFMTPNSTVTYK